MAKLKSHPTKGIKATKLGRKRFLALDAVGGDFPLELCTTLKPSKILPGVAPLRVKKAIS
tara:strand:+ start:408 stop:587 length:180 start_codon:yes stop_codon:yes gene_type:complete